MSKRAPAVLASDQFIVVMRDVVPVLTQLVSKGVEWARQNDVSLSGRVRQFVAELDELDARPVADVGQASRTVPALGQVRTVSEVAIELGVSTRQVRRMCKEGAFPGAFKTSGGHWRIPQQAAEAA